MSRFTLMSVRRMFAARVVALVLVAAFGASMTGVAAISTPTCCGHCPIDCPMHAHGIGCHHTSGALAARGHEHCHRQRDGGPGLRSAGCTGRPDGFAPSAQPLILPAAVQGPSVAPPTRVAVAAQQPWTDVTLDPPFHPPPILPRYA